MSNGTRDAITGVVLAGGMGRRMGSVAKALLPLWGRPLIAHVVDRLRPQVRELLVNVNTDEAQYAAFGDRVIPDQIAGRPGPLAGLQAGLVQAHHPWVLAVPCDSPNAPSDLAERLMHAVRTTGAEIAVASAGGRIHPVFCLVSSALAQPLGDYLVGGGRAVMGWIETRRFVVVEFEDERAFVNVNTPLDLASLEATTNAIPRAEG
jgi:molybdopterin-guanine dinucleotide biosynthesis protein A